MVKIIFNTLKNEASNHGYFWLKISITFFIIVSWYIGIKYCNIGVIISNIFLLVSLIWFYREPIFGIDIVRWYDYNVEWWNDDAYDKWDKWYNNTYFPIEVITWDNPSMPYTTLTIDFNRK